MTNADDIKNVTNNESDQVRQVPNSKGAEGVVRGFAKETTIDQQPVYVPVIGKPDAPIHFMVVEDFACPHCQDYHESDLSRIIKDYVITGKATLQFVMTTGTGQEFSKTASQAALCAGEQGAYWEMADELFRLANTQGFESAFAPTQIQTSADKMGLDGKKILSCLGSGRYRNYLDNYAVLANDNGVTGTPTLLVRYGTDTKWQKVPDRGYDNVKSLIEAANK